MKHSIFKIVVHDVRSAGTRAFVGHDVRSAGARAYVGHDVRSAGTRGRLRFRFFPFAGQGAKNASIAPFSPKVTVGSSR
jgi:hypothetical protein